MRILHLFSLLILAIASCGAKHDFPPMERIDGVSCVAPPSVYQEGAFDSITAINAEWVAILPYAYLDPDDPEVVYDLSWQWWGETSEGVLQQIRDAKTAGLKVLLKPHVWVKGQGWNGDFQCKKEADWSKWEQSYARYINAFAIMADSMEVEMFCIGLEYRLCVVPRESFWRDLISDVRSKYSGPLTYAANWDNYQKVPFWDELDYIGVNAYFPVSDDETPQADQMLKAYKSVKNDLASFASRTKKPILFTEYGFRSVSKSAGKQWELPNSHWGTGGDVNLEAQLNAYQSIFDSFWEEDWFAGGFLWNWYYDRNAGGETDPDYTPQGKPVIDLIKERFKD